MAGSRQTEQGQEGTHNQRQDSHVTGARVALALHSKHCLPVWDLSSPAAHSHGRGRAEGGRPLCDALQPPKKLQESLHLQP